MRGIVRSNVVGPYLRAKLMLNMLGFKGFHEFSKICGINFATAAVLLYDSMKTQTQTGKVACAYEVMRSAYDEKQQTMDPDEKRYVRAWLKKWTKELLNTRTLLEQPGRRVVNATEKDIQRGKQRLRERRKRLKAILQWTPTRIEKTGKKKKKKCR